MNQSELKQKMQKVLEFLEGEFSKIRSSRANTELISGIKVTAYGTEMPLTQLGTISVVDATLLAVQPYDKSVVGEIEKAIRNSNLGLNPVVDGTLIRIPLPPLSQERREEFVKIVKQKSEEAKISIRQIRHESMEDLDNAKKDGSVREDQYNQDKKVLQDIVDEFNKKVDELFKKKSDELMTI